MLRSVHLIVLLFFFLPAAFPLPAIPAAPLAAPPRGELRVNVSNLARIGGKVWVGIYASSEDFLDRSRALLYYQAVTVTGSLTLHIPDLPAGTYAVALFHDENDNGELDTNFLGLPTEPWAFSGEPKTRLRLPRFDEVEFHFSGRGDVLDVRLRNW